MSSDLRRYLALVLSQGLRLPLGVLNVGLLARVLGPEGIGQWAILVALATVLHSVLVSWTQAGNVRFGREEWQEKRSLAATWRGRWPWLCAGLALGSAVLWAHRWTPLALVFRLPSEWRLLPFGYLVSLWFMAESQSLLQIKGRFARLALWPVLPMSLSAAFLSALLSKGIRDESWLVAVAGLVTINLAFWGAAWWLEFKDTRSGWALPRRGELARTLQYGWPLVPGFLIGFVSDWGDHLLLQWYFSSRDVGFFQVAYQTMLTIAGLSAPLTTILLPRLIDRNAGDPGAARSHVTRVFPTVVALWALGMIPLLTLLPTVLLWVLGRGFEGALPVLDILSLSLPGVVLSQLYTVLFSLQGRLSRTVLYLALMSGTNVAVSLLFIPNLGPAGAAIGTSVSYLLSQYLYLNDQHAFLGIPKRTILLVHCSFVVSTGLLALAGDQMPVRIATGLASLVWIIALTRRHGVVDGDVLRTILSGRFEPIGVYMSRLLVRTARA